MALNLNWCDAARNAGMDAKTATIGASGKLKIYAGTQPTDADTALSGQTLLAVLSLSADAFGDAADGVATANSITNDSSADGTGTATWGTLTTSGDVRKLDFTVGTSGTDMIIDNTSITAGQVVSCSSFVLTAGNV